MPEAEIGSSVLSLRQGANSDSTANVTRMRISGGASGGDFFGAARRDVTVRFVPTNGAFEGRGHRPGLEAQFLLRACCVHEHHVPRDFHTFDRNLRLAAEQARKRRLCIGYT